MTRTFKISAGPNATRKARQAITRGSRMHRKHAAQDEEHHGYKMDKTHYELAGANRRWNATIETYDPASPQQKYRTPMDIKGSKAPRDRTMKRFYINVNHDSTRDLETEHLDGLEDDLYINENLRKQLYWGNAVVPDDSCFNKSIKWTCEDAACRCFKA